MIKRLQLKFICISLGELGNLVHVGFPVLSSVDREVSIKFSCDVKFFAELFTEL